MSILVTGGLRHIGYWVCHELAAKGTKVIATCRSNLYGAAKASSEFFGLQYANEFGLDFRALRVYFAYGPGRLSSKLESRNRRA